MFKIRVNGTLDEIEASKKRLESVFRVLSVSKPYKDRGKNEMWRIYMECENIHYKEEVIEAMEEAKRIAKDPSAKKYIDFGEILEAVGGE